MNYSERISLSLERAKKKKEIITLAIESSCDETSVAVLRNLTPLSNIISTQIDIHKKFGGVVPEVASRNHTLAINSVYEEALKIAEVKPDDIDIIAVTYGAGLSGSLLIGVSFAKALSFALGKPLFGVNHIKGHIAGNFIGENAVKPPLICLVVSGGHTALLNMTDYTEFELYGATVDDACGEAFDKVARVIGLNYPGGPQIDRLAREGVADYAFPKIAKATDNGVVFSYSGLKTSVINYVHNKQQRNEEINKSNLCASFEKAALDPLVDEAVKLAKRLSVNTVAIAGGVSANTYLRKKLNEECEKNGLVCSMPKFEYCTDNAAMIGAEGYLCFKAGYAPSGLELKVSPYLRFDR